MKAIKNIGLVIFLIGLAIFTGSLFTGSFNLTESEFNTFIESKGYKSEVIKDELKKAIVTDENLNVFQFSSRVRAAYQASGPFSSFNTPLGHTAEQIPQPTQLERTMFSPF